MVMITRMWCLLTLCLCSLQCLGAQCCYDLFLQMGKWRPTACFAPNPRQEAEMVGLVILVQPELQLGVRGTAPGAAQCPADLHRLAICSSARAFLLFLVDSLTSSHMRKALPTFSLPSVFLTSLNL